MNSVIEGVPNPGSNEAGLKGCICPRSDNGYGNGYMDGRTYPDGKVVFVWCPSCPIHGKVMKEYYA